MYKAFILPLAKQDISDAVTWYESKQKGLGKLFVEEIRSKVLFIRNNPKTTTIKYDDIRCAILDVFPFMVHYTIDELQKTIIVVAVFHTSLNPERWRKR
jgi:plasmid stabilization system protein ParE